jgi:hypothetical protein
MGQEYNEKMFPIHTSIILIGVLVGATSLWPLHGLLWIID